MKIFYLILFFAFCTFYSQENQNDYIYFIGEKLEEKHIPYTITNISAEKKDCEKNDEDERCFPIIAWVKCKGGGDYYSKYKILKLLKGTYIKDTIEFSSTYCSEFGYSHPLKNKYVIIGLKKNNNNWFQFYIDKVYRQNDKWILPYKTTYSFINYELMKPQKLKNSQQIRLNISKEYSERLLKTKYDEPYYKVKRKYAVSLYGFIF